MGARLTFVLPLLIGAIALPTLTQCTSFPPLAAGTCGNAVIDPGEDCDGFPRGAGTACGAPGSPTACRLTCSFAAGASDAGAPAACPPGWGCGADGICRQPTGAFARRPEAIVAGATRVSLADFDGDHRQDVLTRGQADARGFSKLRAHYFNGDMSLAATALLPTKVGSPAARDMNGDGIADLAFTLNQIDTTLSGLLNGAVGVLLGQSDRTFSPVAYPTFVFSDTQALMYPITGFPGEPLRILVFGSSTMMIGGAALLHPDTATGMTGLLIPVPDGPAALAGGGAKVARVIETAPCDDLVWAYTGKTSATVFVPCRRDITGWVWNDGGATIDLPLPAGVTVDTGVRVADVNADGHRDVLVGASGKTYVAYGDGKGVFTPLSTPFAVPVYLARGVPPTITPLPLPLAIGELSGDNKVDFVTPQLALTSVKGDPNGGYVIAFFKSPGAWTSAAVADFNGNGYADVVAGSATDLDLDFLNGTGTIALNPSTIATIGTPSQFTVGDVDGDLLPDLVFAESSPSSDDELAIAFGKPDAIPDTPIAVGHFGRISEAVTFNPGGAVDSIGVISYPVDPSDKSVAISLLAGSGDRLPLAPFSLVQQPSLDGVPLNVVLGSFAPDKHVDLVALAADASTSAFSSFRFWIVPAAAPTRFRASVAGDPLPAALHPISGAAMAQRAAAITASGDVDKDGTDDVVAVMPYTKDETTSALVVAKPKDDGKGGVTIVASDPVSLPFPIALDGQLALADVDGDGALDVVLLGGKLPSRSLVVLWNDGAGAFSAARSLTVNANDDVATDFAFVRVSLGLPAIVYVTRKSVVVAGVAADRATVKRTTIDATLSYATGVAGGDIDGDGVDDIAVADTPSLILYKGQPALK